MIFITIASLLAHSALAAPTPPQSTCTSSREFITSYEFLKDQGKVFQIPEGKALELAKKIAQGCTGAAGRFIRVSLVLSKAGLSGKDAIHEGIEFADKTDSVTETFLTVFTKGYLPESLDLNLGASIKLAKSLSTEFDGDALAVREDFSEIVRYCSEEKSLGLPKTDCADLAARIVKKGEPYSGGIGKDFLEIVRFLRGHGNDLNYSVSDSIGIAEKVIGYGPAARENFFTAYQYAIDPNGLGTTSADGVKIAQEMAKLTVKK